MYLGAYSNKVQAARAHDVMALKVKNDPSDLNFPIEDYAELQSYIGTLSQVRRDATCVAPNDPLAKASVFPPKMLLCPKSHMSHNLPVKVKFNEVQADVVSALRASSKALPTKTRAPQPQSTRTVHPSPSQERLSPTSSQASQQPSCAVQRRNKRKQARPTSSLASHQSQQEDDAAKEQDLQSTLVSRLLHPSKAPRFMPAAGVPEGRFETDNSSPTLPSSFKFGLPPSTGPFGLPPLPPLRLPVTPGQQQPRHAQQITAGTAPPAPEAAAGSSIMAPLDLGRPSSYFAAGFGGGASPRAARAARRHSQELARDVPQGAGFAAVGCPTLPLFKPPGGGCSTPGGTPSSIGVVHSPEKWEGSGTPGSTVPSFGGMDSPVQMVGSGDQGFMIKGAASASRTPVRKKVRPGASSAQSPQARHRAPCEAQDG